MKTKTVFITDHDATRLSDFIEAADDSSFCEMELIRSLRTRLDKAKIIKQKNAPQYLVTMNSYLRITDLGAKTDMNFWLSFPRDALKDKEKVSVISDIGVAIIGSKVGDVVESVNSETKRQFRIAQIYYQPEHNEHYNL